jgi:hypothetical protein
MVTTGRPSNGLDQAHDGHGPEIAAARTKARAKIRDAQCVAARIGEHRLDDGGVAQIAPLDLRGILHVHREYAARRIAAVAVQQRAKHRVRIGPRQAGPHDAGARIDERGDLAVADECKI